LDLVNNIFTPRISVQASLAARAAATISFSRFMLRTQYTRIEPNYTTLGAYYFNTDVENITVSPSADLYKDKLRVSLSLGRQRDNLANQKLAQTIRTIGSADFAWNPSSAFGLNVQYGNYSTNQQAGLRQLNDTTHVKNISQNIMAAPRMTFVSRNQTHTTTLLLYYQEFIDKNPITKAIADAKAVTASLSYSLRFTPTGLTLSLSWNITSAETGGLRSQTSGGNLAISANLFKNALNWSFSSGYSSTARDSEVTSGTILGQTRLSYNIGRSNTISLNINYIKNISRSPLARSFDEFTTNLTYSTRFSM
jgi:hypothetical protein